MKLQTFSISESELTAKIKELEAEYDIQFRPESTANTHKRYKTAEPYVKDGYEFELIAEFWNGQLTIYPTRLNTN